MAAPFVCFTLLALSSSAALADIKLGLVLPLTGPLATTGNDIANGAKAYVESINAAGGLASGPLKGKKLELMIEDDKFDPKASEELARKLVKERGAVALLSCFGTVNCLAVAKVAQETGAPLIGPIAGAEVLRKADNTKVFALRANATEEISALVKYLTGIGQTSAAVAVQDDGFGKAYAASFKTASETKGFSASALASFDPKAPNYPAIAKALLDSQPSSIILIANTLHSVGIINALNQAQYFGQILNLAGQANGGFVKGLAGGKQIAIFAALTLSPTTSVSLAAIDYRAALGKQAGAHASYLSFESYLNTRLAGEALRRSTANSAAALSTALQNLNQVDIGGITVSFAGGRRQGANFADLGVLKADGTFRQ